jgi:hypothetical protein
LFTSLFIIVYSVGVGCIAMILYKEVFEALHL